MWSNPDRIVCPICQEDELWLSTSNSGSGFAVVKCYLCGWDSGIIVLGTDESMESKIAATVAAASAPGGESGVNDGRNATV